LSIEEASGLRFINHIHLHVRPAGVVAGDLFVQGPVPIFESPPANAYGFSFGEQSASELGLGSDATEAHEEPGVEIDYTRLKSAIRRNREWYR
jgi:hypothetical protein